MSSISGSSGSGSGSIEVTTTNGGGSTLSDSYAANLGASVSAKSSDTQSKRHKSMDREEKMA